MMTGIDRIREIRSRIEAIRGRFNFATPKPAKGISIPPQEAPAPQAPLAEGIPSPDFKPLAPKNFSQLMATLHQARETIGAVGTKATSMEIDTVARKFGLSPALLRSVVSAESGFNPDAISPKGAMGLMQLMPETAKEMGVNDPFNPDENLEGGAKYLSRMLRQFDNNLDLALSAYNAGPGRVREHQGVPPIPETRKFIEKVRKGI